MKNEFDVVVVGSGAGGATVARELSRRGQKVLILERGSNRPLSDSLSGIAAVGRERSVGENLKSMTAHTVGGSTSVYFGVCKLPNAETFAKLRIDCSAELAEVRRELPIAELPDEFLQPQSRLVRDAARELGYTFRRHPMLIDQSRCAGGAYSYAAKWNARAYVDDALAHGATLVAGAEVQQVIVENGRAIGVVYRAGGGLLGRKTERVFAKRVVLAAGALATPKLLMDCGVQRIGERGFFCKPAIAVFGTVPGLNARDAFLGQLDCDLGNGLSMGDGAMNASLFRLFMLANRRWRHIFAHSSTVSIGILMNDEMSGRIRDDGRYYKRLKKEELEKLASGAAVARQILQRAGARDIFVTRPAAGIPGGVLRVDEELDQDLQTKVKNLYVCDHSVVCDEKITPTVLLICLAKRLARHLAAARQPQMIREHAA